MRNEGDFGEYGDYEFGRRGASKGSGRRDRDEGEVGERRTKPKKKDKRVRVGQQPEESFVSTEPPVVIPQEKQEIGAVEVQKNNQPVDLGLTNDLEVKSMTHEETQLSEDEIRIQENARKFVDLVIDRGIKDYSELNPVHQEDEEDEKAANQIFKRVARAAIDQLVVHGLFKETENGLQLQNVSDTDGEGVVALCKMAGLGFVRWIDEKSKERKRFNVTYVAPGEDFVRETPLNPNEKGQGIFVGDTSGKNFEVNLEEGKVYDDHHANDSRLDTCATKQAYEVFTAVGLIEASPDLQDTVDFITNMDNGTYPGVNDLDNFRNSANTLVGIYRHLAFAEIRYFFNMPDADPAKPLSDDLIKRWSIGKKIGLASLIEQDRVRIEESLEAIDKLEEQKFVIETEKYGKVLIDVDGSVKKGSNAAYARGYQTYVRWDAERNSFGIYSLNGVSDTFEQGFGVRGQAWVKKGYKDGELSFGLVDVLRKLGGGGFDSDGGLTVYLENEEEKRKQKETGQKEQTAEDFLNEIDEEETMMTAGDLMKEIETEEKEDNTAGDFLKELEGEEKLNPETADDFLREIEEEHQESAGEFLKEIEAEEAEQEKGTAIEIETGVEPEITPAAVTEVPRPVEKFEDSEAILVEPETEREMDVEESGSTRNLVTEMEANERMVSQQELNDLRILEEEQRQRQLELVMELSRRARAREEEERRLTWNNLFSGRFWRRAWKDTKSWFKRTFGG